MKSALTSSRAVARKIAPGLGLVCVTCSDAIKFVAKAPAFQVIANVYEGSTWRRVDHFHLECYLESGEPFGPVSQAS